MSCLSHSFRRTARMTNFQAGDQVLLPDVCTQQSQALSALLLILFHVHRSTLWGWSVRRLSMGSMVSFLASQVTNLDIDTNANL
jgi:hypothetical protein